MAHSQKLQANATAFSYLCEELNKQPTSQDQLQERVGISNATVVKWMRILRNRKLIYIAEWKRHPTACNWIAMWSWGYKEFSALKPKPSTNAENCKRHRRLVLQRQEKPLTKACV